MFVSSARFDALAFGVDLRDPQLLFSQLTRASNLLKFDIVPQLGKIRDDTRQLSSEENWTIDGPEETAKQVSSQAVTT